MGERRTGSARLPASVIATLVALPLALVVGGLAYWRLGGYAHPAASRSVPASAAPRARSTGPVALPAPSLDDRRAVVCRALVAKLPNALRDLDRRPVDTGRGQNAAYGDPAITLACGAALPSILPTATVYPLSGVCWYAAERPDVTVWTTLDREVPVQVTVPRWYQAPGQWVIEFSAPVAAAVPPAGSGVPAGCTG
jgi:hypothetical protein